MIFTRFDIIMKKEEVLLMAQGSVPMLLADILDAKVLRRLGNSNIPISR
jgi:hypothetical protein